MVTKKTSKEDVKKVSAPVAADAKKPAGKTAKPAKVSDSKVKEKKAVVKAKPSPKKKPEVDYTPVAVNKDIVADVLDIKAKNETKKAQKAAKVTVAKTTQSPLMEEKGSKAVSAKNRRDAVKENAQKAEAKKFMALKEEVAAKKECNGCCCFLGIKTLFAAWASAYKKIFNYNTRSSRYDFWAYMLVNLIVSLVIVIPYQNEKYQAMFNGGEISAVLQVIYWIISLIMLFASLALVVRRLHDFGVGGWKGFFRPMTFSALGIIVLMVVSDFVVSDEQIAENVESVTAGVLGISVLVLVLVNFYYLCKTFIAAGFMEGEQAENAYGLPIFADDCTKAKVLRYASLYAVIFSIYMVVMILVIYYLSMALFMGGKAF